METTENFPIGKTILGDGERRKFLFNVKFFPSEAKLGDGSVHNIEGGTYLDWEVDFADIDPQEL
jgi:hypothetical protein